MARITGAKKSSKKLTDWLVNITRDGMLVLGIPLELETSQPEKAIPLEARPETSLLLARLLT